MTIAPAAITSFFERILALQELQQKVNGETAAAALRADHERQLQKEFIDADRRRAEAAQIAARTRPWLTIAEAADVSGLPKSYLRLLVRQGKLKTYGAGSGRRISRASLEKFRG
jgi:excisionase family DNA binding protein